MTSTGLSGCTIPAVPIRPIHATDVQMPFPRISAMTAAAVIQRVWLQYAKDIESSMQNMMKTMEGLSIGDDELTDLIFNLGDYPQVPQNEVSGGGDITSVDVLMQMQIHQQWDRWADKVIQYHNRLSWILAHCRRRRRPEQNLDDGYNSEDDDFGIVDLSITRHSTATTDLLATVRDMLEGIRIPDMENQGEEECMVEDLERLAIDDWDVRTDIMTSPEESLEIYLTIVM